MAYLRGLLAALAITVGLAVLPAAGQTPQPRAGNAAAVDLELILAVDISLSMDLDELRVQRGGYVGALRDPDVQRAILGGPRRRIAVSYFEWAGQTTQLLIAPWTLIDSAAAANALADLLERAPISRHRMTSLSGAMLYGERLFEQSPFNGARRVLDISGDGPNNNGPPVVALRDRLVGQGIVINGLPVMLKLGGSVFDIKELDIYYNDCVIGGAGAFMIPVTTEAEFLPAIRRKLLLEISGLALPARAVHVQAASDTPRIDCRIGENLWQRYMDGRF